MLLIAGWLWDHAKAEPKPLNVITGFHSRQEPCKDVLGLGLMACSGLRFRDRGLGSKALNVLGVSRELGNILYKDYFLHSLPPVSKGFRV